MIPALQKFIKDPSDAASIQVHRAQKKTIYQS